jgi:hypothetical protein
MKKSLLSLLMIGLLSLTTSCGPKAFTKGEYDEDINRENNMNDLWSETDMQKVVADLVAGMTSQSTEVVGDGDDSPVSVEIVEEFMQPESVAFQFDPRVVLRNARVEARSRVPFRMIRASFGNDFHKRNYRTSPSVKSTRFRDCPLWRPAIAFRLES